MARRFALGAPPGKKQKIRGIASGVNPETAPLMRRRSIAPRWAPQSDPPYTPFHDAVKRPENRFRGVFLLGGRLLFCQVGFFVMLHCCQGYR